MAGKKLVYIAACGIGLGHIGRVVAVADEFRRRGIECVFSTYGPAHRYISSCGYRSYEAPALMWEEEPDGSIATGRSAARMFSYASIFYTHLKQEKERISRLKPDAVISDSRYSTVFAMDHFDIPFFFISNQIRFLMPRWQDGGWPGFASDRISSANYRWLSDADEIFIPDFPLPHSISRENMQVPPRILSRLRFVGPITRRRPGELPDAQTIRERYGFGADLFVYAAVSGPGRSRAPIITALQKALPSFRRKSIIVRGEPGNSQNDWPSEYVNVRGWAEDRYELMKSCDVVVSRPGLTTISEIVNFGKAAVLIPTPTQSEQEGNARSLEALGAARLIEQSRVSELTLRGALEDIVANSDRYGKATARLMEMAHRQDGARNIVEKILEYIG